jgi:hypothetical protein
MAARAKTQRHDNRQRRSQKGIGQQPATPFRALMTFFDRASKLTCHLSTHWQLG